MWGLGLASRLRLAVACVVTCGWRAGKGGARDLCTPCRSYRLVLEFPKIGINSDVRDPWLPAQGGIGQARSTIVEVELEMPRRRDGTC